MYIIYIFIYLCIENGWICMYMCPHISDVVLIVFVLYRGLGTVFIIFLVPDSNI